MCVSSCTVHVLHDFINAIRCFFLFFSFIFSRILLSKHFKILNLFYSRHIIFFLCVYIQTVLAFFFPSSLQSISSVYTFIYISSSCIFNNFANPTFFFLFPLSLCVCIFYFLFLTALSSTCWLAGLFHVAQNRKNWGVHGVCSRTLFYTPFAHIHILSDLYT